MFDVLIIGGGIVGTSIARQLSKYTCKVGLLEKNIEICTETTKANSAIIHAGYDNKPGTLKAKLNVEGSRMMESISKELDFPYKKLGSLVLAFNNRDLEIINDLYKRGQKNKISDLEILSAEDVRAMEKSISEELVGGLYAPSAAIVDPFNYTYAMAENASSNGVKFYTGEEVISIDSLKGEKKIRVETKNNTYTTKVLINAAGLYSDKIANMVGDQDFKIIPTKGVYRVLRKDACKTLNKILFQTPSKAGKGVLITPTYAGNTLIGPTSHVISSDNLIDQNQSLSIIDTLGKKSIPSIDVGKSIRVFTGIRAKPDRGDFCIYKSKKLENCIHVGGIESPGLSSAPAIAKYVEEILKSLDINLELDPNYNPRRRAIGKADIKGDIICRCEQVSEGEIIESIRRPLGARTVNGIKRRVRPGMGPCQGNYCRPRVEKILKRELGVDKLYKNERSGEELEEVLRN